MVHEDAFRVPRQVQHIRLSPELDDGLFVYNISTVRAVHINQLCFVAFGDYTRPASYIHC